MNLWERDFITTSVVLIEYHQTGNSDPWQDDRENGKILNLISELKHKTAMKTGLM
jgi:hypothetical protein